MITSHPFTGMPYRATECTFEGCPNPRNEAHFSSGSHEYWEVEFVNKKTSEGYRWVVKGQNLRRWDLIVQERAELELNEGNPEGMMEVMPN